MRKGGAQAMVAVALKIYNFVMMMIMKITNFVKTCRGDATVYSPEDFSKVGY